MRKPRLSAVKQRQLRRLIEETTVDCYNEWEQASGFLTMIQDHIACPVIARVVGEPVQVIDCCGRSFPSWKSSSGATIFWRTATLPRPSEHKALRQ